MADKVISTGKPSWNDAPEWAKWLAMDEVGTWYWYEQRPSMKEDDWYPSGGKVDIAGRSTHWADSREERPHGG